MDERLGHLDSVSLIMLVPLSDAARVHTGLPRIADDPFSLPVRRLALPLFASALVFELYDKIMLLSQGQ